MTPTVEPVEIGHSPDIVMEAHDAICETLLALGATALDGSEAMCILLKSTAAKIAERLEVPIDADALMQVAPRLGEIATVMAGGRGLVAMFLLALTLHGMLGSTRVYANRGAVN